MIFKRPSLIQTIALLVLLATFVVYVVVTPWQGLFVMFAAIAIVASMYVTIEYFVSLINR